LISTSEPLLVVMLKDYTTVGALPEQRKRPKVHRGIEYNH
jgi:hypothetical protein